MKTENAVRYQDWVGKKQAMNDVVSPWPVAALCATLDRNDPEPRTGDPVPPGWHWLYFLEATAASGLGHDGLARRGGFLPPVTLPRRMWAGGRMEFRQPLRVGDSIRRDSQIVSVEQKQGHGGQLVFVTVRHTVTSAGNAATIEEHDIVYREAARAGDAAPRGKPVPAQAGWQRDVTTDPVMLFRMSALIFNANRIHYDLPYCRDQGYPGLVVHGPLQALLLLDLCRRHEARPVRRFDYRAHHPLFEFERFTVNGNPSADGSQAELWTANPAGWRAMAGTAYFA